MLMEDQLNNTNLDGHDSTVFEAIEEKEQKFGTESTKD